MRAPPEDALRRGRVVVLASQSVSGQRVHEDALALLRLGFDVTVLRLGEVRRRTESTDGGVRSIHLPVPVTSASPDRAASWRRAVRRLGAASARAPLLRGIALAAITLAAKFSSFVGRALRRGLRWVSRTLDTVGGSLPFVVPWRRLRPEVEDYEVLLGQELDRLNPDAVHVLGAPMLDVAARAVERAARAGSNLAWVYDSTAAPRHPVDDPARAVREDAQTQLERQWAPLASRVLVAEGRKDPARARPRPKLNLREVPINIVSGVDGDVLSSAYADLLPRDKASADVVAPDNAPQMRRDHPVIGIGPANMAGQAWAWAKALEREFPRTHTEVIMVDRGSPLMFPADEVVPQATYGRDKGWQRLMRDHIDRTWTHALIEAGRPLMGVLHGRTFANDAAVLKRAGIKVGLVFHGSELRDPRRHAQMHRWSPFKDTSDDWVKRVQATVDLLRPDLDKFDGPCFVSTPDLLEDLPTAMWLPVVVDCEKWLPRTPPDRDVPVVVHTPSRAAIKGSSFVDAALRPLMSEGLVEYRRVEGVPPQQMPEVLAEADLVLDQFAIASYGVLACQAMASGVAVVGHISSYVRSVVREQTGQDLPIIEANPETLQDTVRRLIADPERRREAAGAGSRFVSRVHDGRRSAQILAQALDIGRPGNSEG